MLQIILGGILAFVATFYAIPVIIKVAEAKKLYDEPDDVRKLHIKPIPLLGGLGIFIGFIFSVLLTVDLSKAPEFQVYILTFLVIFFVGVKDDILLLTALKKFAVQLIVAGILIFKGNLIITSMQNFLGFQHLPLSISWIISLLTIVVIINAFNLIDGVDGLAGSLGLISSAVFGTFFLVNGNQPYAILAYGLAGSLAAFLIFNFQPAKIFMGDTGSLLLGLVNSILVIKFIETGLHKSYYTLAAAPAVGFSILLLPLLDTLRVFGLRILKGRSPFSADRNHIHHLLLDRGLNHRTVTLICIAACIFFTAVGFVFQGVGTTWLIAGLTVCFYLSIYCLHLTKKKVNMRVIKSEREKVAPVVTKEEVKRVRLVSLFNRAEAAVVEED